MTSPTVAVVGLGAIGSMAVLSLSRRGACVTGFEQGAIGLGATAAYGGGTRQYSLGASSDEDVELGRSALRFWDLLEEQSRETLRIPTGHLTVGPSLDPEVAARVAALDRAGSEHEILGSIDALRRFPQHILTGEEVAVYAKDGGVLRSNRAVRTAVNLAENWGARIRPNKRVLGLEVGSAGVTLKFTDRSERFDYVVVTTGPWITELVPSLRDRVVTRGIVCSWVTPEGGALSFAPADFPPGVRRSIHGHSFTFLPSVDRKEPKFVYWIPMRSEIAVADSLTLTCEPWVIDATRRSIERTIRGLSGEILESVKYMEGFTVDRTPVIGRPADRVAVLSGFSGSGFKVAPVMGEVVADLVLRGDTDYPIGRMLDERFSRSLAAIGPKRTASVVPHE